MQVEYRKALPEKNLLNGKIVEYQNRFDKTSYEELQVYTIIKTHLLTLFNKFPKYSPQI